MEHGDTPLDPADSELTDRPRSGSTDSTVHKRGLPGTLLSKLSFMRASQTSIGDTSDRGFRREITGLELAGATEGAVASALQQQRKTRRRKGSLRKTALLGPGVLRPENREKRGV